MSRGYCLFLYFVRYQRIFIFEKRNSSTMCKSLIFPQDCFYHLLHPCTTLFSTVSRNKVAYNFLQFQRLIDESIEIQRRERKKELLERRKTRMNGVLFFQSVKESTFELCWRKARRERRALSTGGARIVRFARGDNLQEMAEMDWRTTLFSPIEKSPSRAGQPWTRVLFSLSPAISSYLSTVPNDRDQCWWDVCTGPRTKLYR